MIKAPSKTSLLTMRSYIDMALANLEDSYGNVKYMHRIQDELERLYPVAERMERQRRLFPETLKPDNNDPDTQEMIAACKQWKSERDWVFAEADESQPVKNVSRSATFSVAQDALKFLLKDN